MTTDERRTHMWQAIVRRAFQPQYGREQAKWLRCFTQSVLQYVDNPDSQSPRLTPTGWRGRFGNRSLLVCEYLIGPERSQFDLLRPDWRAQYGIDVTAFAPISGADETVDSVAPGDVDCVLRGMLEHPRVHLHVHEDPPDREVRIATGLAMPYLFLFQLCRQLCPRRREGELNRLSGIFTQAWFDRRDPVTPSHLFGLQ
ncbi:MAG: hypothetical protein FJ387_06815 [Verrucomicrobia bacterium]|nr:hypothetical protein [Verrucomicrobiota bacterium]